MVAIFLFTRREFALLSAYSQSKMRLKPVPKVLSQQQVEQYRAQEFLSPVDVMSEDEALSYAGRLQAAEQDYPQQLNAESVS